MTISSTANRVSYAGDGTSTAFSFPYYFQAQGDLVVLSTDNTTGIDTTKTLTTDYTVSGTQDANGFYSAGGTVTFNTAPASGTTITIYRDPPLTQLTAYVDNSPLPAASIQGPVDKLTTLAQRSRDLVNRTLRQPDGDTTTIAALPGEVLRANGGAGTYAGYDGSGNPTTFTIANGGSSVPISTAMQPVVQAASLAAARTAMAAAGLGDNNTFTGTATFQALMALVGAALNEAKATVASAATTAIFAAAGNYVQITGATTITAFDTIQAGTRRTVEFAGALTLTNNASIILPGNANITTAAGDTAIFVSEGAGVARCVSYTPAGSVPLLPISMNLAANGHIQIGSFILNWGSATFSGATSQAITFSQSFASGAYAIAATPISAGGTSTTTGVQNLTTAGVTLTTGATYTGTLYWAAVGK